MESLHAFYYADDLMSHFYSTNLVDADRFVTSLLRRDVNLSVVEKDHIVRLWKCWKSMVTLLYQE